MDRDEALKLLRGGSKGVRGWVRLSGIDLSGIDLSGADLNGANLSGVNLSLVTLSRVDLTRANLSRANLSGANLSGAKLNEARLNGANLSGANLSWAELKQANLSAANLSEADLSRADLTRANLIRADARGAILSQAKLKQANLSGANLSGGNLIRADLSGVDLSEADLSGANLSGSNLNGTDLKRANLSWAELKQANLSEANLSEANLSRADLTRANLNGASLNKANLSKADLRWADLIQAGLTGADLSNANLAHSDLTDALVELADVDATIITFLRGLPRVATCLRRGQGLDPLIGEAAKAVFHLPAVVEVYLDRSFTEQEMGLYHLHLAEIKHAGLAAKVYLLGHRQEGAGSVLRFQASTYSEVYEDLPDLLAPFMQSQAIDWRRTLATVPNESRTEAITALVRVEGRLKRNRWQLAERLYEVFSTFRGAKVYRIGDGNNHLIRVDVFTNESKYQELQKRLAPPSDLMPTLEFTGNHPTILLPGATMSQQHFSGGTFTGCQFGDRNSQTNYFNAVDQSAILPDDAKQKLKEAREAIEKEALSDKQKKHLVEQLVKLTEELREPQQDTSLIKSFWESIKAVAPTVASILGAATSIQKLLGP